MASEASSKRPSSPSTSELAARKRLKGVKSRESVGGEGKSSKKSEKKEKKVRESRPNGVDEDLETPTKSKSKRSVAGQKHDVETAEGKGEKASKKPAVVRPARNASSRASSWKLSKPAGGRALTIATILAKDDRYLLVAHADSIHVYSTANSLRLRSIPIPVHTDVSSDARPPTPTDRIVSIQLSKANDDLVWVACRNGVVYSFNWVNGSEPLHSFLAATGPITDMKVFSTTKSEGEMAQDTTNPAFDFVLTTEAQTLTQVSVVLYRAEQLSSSSTPTHRILFQQDLSALVDKLSPDHVSALMGLHSLSFDVQSKSIVAATHSLVVAGKLRSTTTGSSAALLLDEFDYEFFVFPVDDVITTTAVQSAVSRADQRIVNVLIGGARGAVLYYHDIFNGLKNQTSRSFLPRKMHWHRRAVNTVQWTLDGNYFITGGSEKTLVIWQLETGRRSFLPNLPANIERVVVSPIGVHYTLQFDDNSIVVLSTAELEPITYISGIQATARTYLCSNELLVRRVGQKNIPSFAHVPTALNPVQPSMLHVCVGHGHQALYGSFPFVQTVDLETFRGVSRQALTRTISGFEGPSPSGALVQEPRVTHLSFTSNGKFMASIDEWTPPPKETKCEQGIVTLQSQQRECYLKFWQVGANRSDPMALITRINTPHEGQVPSTVLNLASDPSTSRFATVGSEGTVRVWELRKTVQQTRKGADVHFHWFCGKRFALVEEQGLTTLAVACPSASEHDVAVFEASKKGRVAFSEDGSTLFVAYGTMDNEGSVYAIDLRMDKVRSVWTGLWQGELFGLEVRGRYLLAVSGRGSLLFDVIAEETIATLPVGSTHVDTGAFPTHVAVDRKSGLFAVATPYRSKQWKKVLYTLYIINPDDAAAAAAKPLVKQNLGFTLSAILTAPSASGFLLLDDEAHVYTFVETSHAYALSLGKSLEDIHVDNGEANVALAEMSRAEQAVGGGGGDDLPFRPLPGSTDILDELTAGAGRRKRQRRGKPNGKAVSSAPGEDVVGEDVIMGDEEEGAEEEEEEEEEAAQQSMVDEDTIDRDTVRPRTIQLDMDAPDGPSHAGDHNGGDGDDDMGGAMHRAIIRPTQLTDIFEPSSSSSVLPAVEDSFLQVASLLAMRI